MKQTNLILLIALGLQLLLAGGLYLNGNPANDGVHNLALTRMEKPAIEKIAIHEDNATRVTLVKGDGDWKLPDYFDLPVDAGRIEALFSSIENTSTGWPVTTTTSSHQRFKVAESDFNKKVTLTSTDGTSETFYLGTSPGFRQLHLRRDGHNEVYAVKLNSFDFPAKSSDWMDKTLLQTNQDISQLSLQDIALQKKDDEWILLQGEGDVDNDATQNLVNALKELRIQGAEDSPAQPQVEHEISVHMGDKTLRYQWFQHNNKYFVKRDDWQPAFTLSQAEYEKFSTQQSTSLVKVMPQQDSQHEEDSRELESSG